VISAHYISSTTLAEQLLPVVAINDYLQINDTSRRDFVNVMAKYGIAMIKGPYFIIMSEIIELFQDLQRANTLQPAATTPPTSTFNQTGQQVGIPSNAAHDINIHVSAPPKRDGAPREQADVVIITALDEELDAVLHHLPRAHRRTFPNDVHVYYHTTVSSSTGERSRRYQVVVLALVDMGRISASDATQEALRRWAPHCVLMVGIAGGIAESGVAIGDVLLADQIVDYEVQKLTEIGPEVRYRVFPVPPKWRAMAQSLHESEWLPLIRVSRPEAGRPKHHTGPVASGDKVQGIAAMVSRYQEFWPKLIGIEMESAGVASVALNITPTPAFFMIRGVSDLANAAKNSAAVEQWRPYACAVAAAYAVALLTSGLIPTRAEVVGDS
jgi:nucleoside phosphorylase